MTDRIDGQRALLPCQSHRFFPLSVKSILSAGNSAHCLALHVTIDAGEADRSLSEGWAPLVGLLGCIAHYSGLLIPNVSRGLGHLTGISQLRHSVERRPAGSTVRTSSLVAVSTATGAWWAQA